MWGRCSNSSLKIDRRLISQGQLCSKYAGAKYFPFDLVGKQDGDSDKDQGAEETSF